MRFTWEFKNPGYYRETGVQDNKTIVVIRGETDDIHAPPEYVRKRLKGYRLLKKFGAASDPFRYKTILEVYAVD